MSKFYKTEFRCKKCLGYISLIKNDEGETVRNDPVCTCCGTKYFYKEKFQGGKLLSYYTTEDCENIIEIELLDLNE